MHSPLTALRSLLLSIRSLLKETLNSKFLRHAFEITILLLKVNIFPDLPGVAEIVLEEEFLVKEGNASFTCYLDELGNPYAEQFLWKLLVPHKF